MPVTYLLVVRCARAFDVAYVELAARPIVASSFDLIVVGFVLGDSSCFLNRSASDGGYFVNLIKHSGLYTCFAWFYAM